jgi:acylaminoacyl-peptidase
MRNPVVNLPSMTTATDIPDWTFVEALGTYDWQDYRPPTAHQLQVMWQKSPVRYVHNVTAPTLVALGLKDLRVPPSQGLEWYHTLRARRVPTKLLTYEEDDHAIAGVEAEADHWVNVR